MTADLLRTPLPERGLCEGKLSGVRREELCGRKNENMTGKNKANGRSDDFQTAIYVRNGTVLRVQ